MRMCIFFVGITNRGGFDDGFGALFFHEMTFMLLVGDLTTVFGALFPHEWQN